MAETIEERVAFLEGKVEEHSRGFGEIRDLITHLDQKVDRFREELLRVNTATNARIDALAQTVSQRIESLEQKVDRRIESLEQKVERFRDELAGRIETLDQKISKQFTWLVGIQVMVLLAIIGALLGK